ncbi:MAG: DUF3052 family protein, partial [Calditrichaeota bacterium]|nr:DUF3052 family protein [Calditrichota bacterium]
YSGTPLVKKLGLKAGMAVLFKNQPSHYFELLDELPEILQLYEKQEKSADFIHFFAIDSKTFIAHYNELKKQLKYDGIFWVSWPKKSSKLATDINENFIRDYALANGLVDVKVCAVDADWSGLKLMYRLSDRPKI